jgi:hypothetical protein
VPGGMAARLGAVDGAGWVAQPPGGAAGQVLRPDQGAFVLGGAMTVVDKRMPHDGAMWLGKYIRDMADLCGLRDWCFTIMSEQPSPSAYADIQITPQQRHASIRVAVGLLAIGGDTLRRCIAHELVHCHMEPLEVALNTVAEGEMSPRDWRVLHNVHNEELERATDALARVLAPFLPLPPAMP